MCLATRGLCFCEEFVPLKGSVTCEGSSSCRLPSNYYHRNVSHLINTHISSHARMTDHPGTSRLVPPTRLLSFISITSPPSLQRGDLYLLNGDDRIIVAPAVLLLILLSSVCCLMLSFLLKIPPATLSSVFGCKMKALPSFLFTFLRQLTPSS